MVPESTTVTLPTPHKCKRLLLPSTKIKIVHDFIDWSIDRIDGPKLPLWSHLLRAPHAHLITTTSSTWLSCPLQLLPGINIASTTAATFRNFIRTPDITDNVELFLLLSYRIPVIGSWAYAFKILQDCHHLHALSLFDFLYLNITISLKLMNWNFNYLIIMPPDKIKKKMLKAYT